MTTLFDPVDLGALRLDNRIVLAPMTRSRGSDDHVQSPLAATYYAQRASAGLLITEGVPISPAAVGYVRVPGIWSEAQIEAWRPTIEAVHAQGARIFAQIWHVGRISHTSLQPDGAAPVAPSAIAAEAQVFTDEGMQPTSTPTAMSTGDIRHTVEAFAQAARNAIEAGFDGVEIHGANGYLLEQFLYSGSNHRTDDYGGPASQRIRFHLEVVDAVCEAIGPARVGLRISPQNTFNGSHDADRRGTFTALGAELARRPLAFLHVLEPISTPPEQRLLPLLRQAFPGVIITNGGYDGASAAAVLERGEADLVAFGSHFISNPDLPARLRLGAPLTPADPQTFYTPGPEGYTDYPSLEARHVHLVALQVTDEAGYARYRQQMGRLLATYGGRFLLDVDAARVRVPTDVEANRVFLLGFPSEAASAAFFDDPTYLAVRTEHFGPSVGSVSRLGSFEPLTP